MDNMDLDIHNYELDDILHLFKMPIHFTEHDMKRAKMIVLKTHPDKSGLDSRYFLFYSKAYKVLHHIWEFQKKGKVNQKNEKNTDYKSIVTSEKEKKQLLDGFFEREWKDKEGSENHFNKKHFNTWFNDLFEKSKMETENDTKGYGNWLKSEDSSGEETKVYNEQDMKKAFEVKKAQARSLIVKKDVSELYSPFGSGGSHVSDLSGQVSDFNSDIFSQLKYQDLYQAHTESVIPVTEEDYESIPKFDNVNEYMSFRSRQNIKPLSEQQAMQYIQNKTSEDEEKSIRRAYELARQSELAEQKNNEFWRNIMYLQK